MPRRLPEQPDAAARLPQAVAGLAAGMRDVVELAARPDRIGELLERALDALIDVIPYDLAAYWEVRGGDLQLRCVRGPLGTPQLLGRRISLERHPTFRRVLESRKARLLEGKQQTPEDTGAYEGVIELPADHASFVIPVLAGEIDVGLMTFDSTDAGVYGPETLEIATIYGHLVGLGLAAARQAETLQDLEETLREQNRLLTEEVEAETDSCRAMEACVSRAMRRVVQMAKQVAISDAPVLVTGETGTGKEVLARAIHGWSNRAEQTFIKVNCAALPENLVESELFGHKKGAFSGATTDRPGRFRLADGGTLLLDEVGDLPPQMQVKLLRVLQEGAFEPVGSDRTVSVDVRILAATNADLPKKIEDGSFREDLFYRLQVFPIEIPALRNRIEDLPALIEQILERIRRRTGRGPWTIGDGELRRMQRHSWPGNVRELLNTIERARVSVPLGGPLKIRIDGATARRGTRREPPEDGWPTLKELERDYVRRVLEKTGGKIYGDDGAAKIVGMPPTTLQSRIARLGLSRKQKKPARG